MLLLLLLPLALCAAEHVAVPVPLTHTGCTCENDNCGCCAHVVWLRINDTACLNITYIPSQLALSLTLLIDGDTVINETVSAKNPNVCVSVPYLREVVSVCLDFVNMTYSLTEITGCVFVEARLLGVNLGKYKLGCFDLKMPTPGAQHMSLSAGERPMQVVDSHPLALAPLLGDDQDAELEPLTGCDCHGHSCACCATASWRHKKHSACLNITYSPSHLSVSLLFTVDGRVAYNDTVGVADLGSICFGIPFIDKLLSVCLEFAGISYSKSHLSGCVDLEAKVFGKDVGHVKLGCFNITTLAVPARS